MLDFRNIYNPEEMATAGFVYHSIGRPDIPARVEQNELADAK
jgi:hypothetical protein